MDKIVKKFIEEAVDLLDKLEVEILKAEKKPEKAPLEEILRVMHTLKGAGAMYGFSVIEKLTHKIESLYKSVQDKKTKLSESIIDLTLKAVDLIRILLNDPEQSDETNFYKQEAIIGQISKIIGKEDKPITEKFKIEEKEAVKTVYIWLKPHKDVYSRGVDLSVIIDNLAKQGQIKVLEYFDDSNSEMLEMSWEIYLVTNQTIESLQDYLFFVEDESSLHKISDFNLFENENFHKKTNDAALQEKPLGIEEVLNFVKELEDAEHKKEKEKYEKIGKGEISSIKVDSEKLDELMNLLSELVTVNSEVKLIVNEDNYSRLRKSVETLDKITNTFRKNILNIRLISVEYLKNKFARLIRDLEIKLDKQIDFITTGMETELDKTILTKLEAPLMHLIRNSIDHGIEDTEIRTEKGKTKQGKILFKAFYSGANVIIEIQDDGAGIDTEKIKQKAIEQKLIKSDEILTEKEIYDLIFSPGFSTAKDLTKVSGRGVGMDIVKKSIDELRGEIDIVSKKDTGTTVSIKLPLMLSIIDTMLVKVGKQFFSIQLPFIEFCTQVKKAEKEKSDNRHLNINGELIPYISLRDVFKIKGNQPDKEKVIVVNNANKKVAFPVDKVIGEHQAVLKPLNDMLIHKEYFSGVSILADGHMSVILDVNKLINDKDIIKQKS